MQDRLLSTEIDAAIGMITVRRAHALNALNAALREQLLGEILALSADPAVRVLVLTGAGDRSFIAGADISEFVGARPPDALALAARSKRLIDAVVECPKPVIALVNGFCLGIGFEVALACDIRIAATTARFGLPEIKLGILPGAGGSVRLTKIAGSSVARMMTMTGDPIPADRALALGLVASVHAPEDLAEAGRELALRLAGLSPFALAQLKSSLNIAVDAPTDAACQTEMKAFALCFSTRDQQEGAKAFLEKRKPVFTGA